jgi:hypothetical protein
MKRWSASLIAFALAIFLFPLCGWAGRFVVPDEDLPTARLGEWKVAFARNGAVVAGSGDEWLMDVGIHYSMPGYNEWGTQIRRSASADRWQEQDDALVFSGTLHDIHRNPRFTFQQRIELLPHGLRLSYEVTPLQKRKLQEFGLTLHLPIVGSRGSRAEFWPGFQSVLFPEGHRRGVLLRNTAQGATVRLPGGRDVALALEKPVKWRSLDDRHWELNTYRLLAIDDAATRALSRGETVTFSFDFLLGQEAGNTVSVANTEVHLDLYGRLALRGAEHDKLIEGGLLADGKRRWLFAESLPSAVGEKEEPEMEVEGRWQHGQTIGRYSAQLDKKGDLCRINYRLVREEGDWPPENVRLAFAVPQGQVASLQVEGGGEPTDGTESAEERSRAELTMKTGETWTFSSPNGWTVVQQKIGRTNCRILSVAPVSSEPEALIWKVEIGRADSAAGEGTE